MPTCNMFGEHEPDPLERLKKDADYTSERIDDAASAISDLQHQITDLMGDRKLSGSLGQQVERQLEEMVEAGITHHPSSPAGLAARDLAESINRPDLAGLVLG